MQADNRIFQSSKLKKFFFFVFIFVFQTGARSRRSVLERALRAVAAAARRLEEAALDGLLLALDVLVGALVAAAAAGGAVEEAALLNLARERVTVRLGARALEQVLGVLGVTVAEARAPGAVVGRHARSIIILIIPDAELLLSGGFEDRCGRGRRDRQSTRAALGAGTGCGNPVLRPAEVAPADRAVLHRRRNGGRSALDDGDSGGAVRVRDRIHKGRQRARLRHRDAQRRDGARARVLGEGGELVAVARHF